MLNNMKNPSSLKVNRKLDRPGTDGGLDLKKLNQLYNDILRPLTLFPTSDRSADADSTLATVQDDTMEEVNEAVCRDDMYTCAMSPFTEDVSKMSANTVCDLVKRRIHKKSGQNCGSVEEQKVFEEVIINEVKVIHETIPLVLSDTILIARERQDLHRRLITHILIVSEQLFVYYLQKLGQARIQAVFSEEANLTRLKAQLLLDCSKFLNLFSAKHYLIEEIKELQCKELARSKTDETSRNRTSPEQTHRKETSGSGLHFTMPYFIRLGRPKRTTPKLQKDVDLMQIGNIPLLDLKKVHSLIPRQKDVTTFPKNIQCEVITTPCPFIHLDDQKTDKSTTKQLPMKKCTSCPNLTAREILADEFSIHLKTYSSECPEILTHSNGKPGKYTGLRDLKSLVDDPSLPKSGVGVDPYFDEEIPPLIRALPHGIADKAKRYKLEALLMELEQKQEQCKINVETKADLHPQTYTVDVLLPNKPLLRRADGQASDRIYTHFTEIPTYPTVYNHFSSEIEAASVTKMDRNLFVGQELKEVYSELTKNISTDHLKFDQDAIIEPCASTLDFSKCAASSTLTRKKDERVINKELDSLASSDKFSSDDQYVPVDKEAARACNSWLAWWKSLVTFDDYMKYLTTKDLDYLKVIYHLYNSDSEDEEQAKLALKKEEEERKRERDKKIADLRAEKQNYTPGMWNINSVLLGGLGTDPGLQDMELEDSKLERESMRSSSKEKNKISHEPLQKKMNSIWKALHVPEVLRLDMVIKYSTVEYQDLLLQAVEMWEKATNIIQKREQILAELEKFERAASDPNRFFQRGYDGTSMARMKESRIRKKFHSQLTEIEQEILELLQEIKKSFNDVVTFKGRPYSEKMQRDKTEMLYWLQQDRRKDVLERNFEKQHAPEAP